MEGEGNNKGAAQVEQKADACSNSALEIEGLPNEMLEMILKQLEVVGPELPDAWNLEPWNSNFRSLIAHRRVCPLWRDFLDEIMEKRLPLTSVLDLRPSTLSQIKPKIGTQTVQLMEEISYPHFLIDYNGKNPFPGTSLEVVVEFHDDRRDDNDEVQAPTIRMIDLITYHFHHLSILYLSSSSYMKRVDLDLFVKFLELSPNLKALILSDMELEVSESTPQRPLPALPKLETLVVENVQEAYCFTWSFNQWLIEPFAGQLVNLTSFFPTPVTVPLPKLEQLTIICSTISALNQNGPAESLKRLCFRIYTWNGNIYDIFGYLDQFRKTLVDLVVDTDWIDLIPEARNKVKGRDPLMEKLQLDFGKLPTSNVRFPCLKTLEFPFPNSTKEMQVMLLSRTVLPKFPALKQLSFFWSDGTPLLSERRSRNLLEHAQENIAQFLKRENYWAICPKLEKITVFKKDGLDDIYFTWGRPVVI